MFQDNSNNWPICIKQQANSIFKERRGRDLINKDLNKEQDDWTVDTHTKKQILDTCRINTYLIWLHLFKEGKKIDRGDEKDLLKLFRQFTLLIFQERDKMKYQNLQYHTRGTFCLKRLEHHHSLVYSRHLKELDPLPDCFQDL